MPPHWLTILRILLRGLKCAQNAKPQKAQLAQMRITIHQTYEPAGSENIGIIVDFLTNRICCQQTQCMVAMFSLQMSADFCSKYVSSMLVGWITKNLSRQCTDGDHIERFASSLFCTNLANLRSCRKPKIRVQNDSYSRGVQPEMMATLQHKTNSDGKCLYVAVVIRKECQSETLITSAELYTLFSMAVNQASAQPFRSSLEVSTARITSSQMLSLFRCVY